jgi:hypothetical protein
VAGNSDGCSRRHADAVVADLDNVKYLAVRHRM